MHSCLTGSFTIPTTLGSSFREIGECSGGMPTVNSVLRILACSSPPSESFFTGGDSTAYVRSPLHVLLPTVWNCDSQEGCFHKLAGEITSQSGADGSPAHKSVFKNG